MARWLITDGDRQFSARDIDELKQMARRSEISAGSMIRPPGAVTWVYATEIPDLRPLLRTSSYETSYGMRHEEQTAAGRRRILIGVSLAVTLLGAILFYRWASSIPDMSELSLLGGPNGLELSQMLVTSDGVSLRREPEGEAERLATLARNERLELLAKRGQWYEVKTSRGVQGWVAVDQVIPAYYFANAKERENYDPIYNADRYIEVKNSRWMQLPADEDPVGQGRAEVVTVFEFILKNNSKFDMKDVRILATVKNRGRRVVAEREIAIEGVVPAYGDSTVGTLRAPAHAPDTPVRRITYHSYAPEAGVSDEAWMNWVDGLEVAFPPGDYAEAEVTVVQATAVVDSRRRGRN
ncbi:MAG: SH3 domain-containing protein [Deltaproteobacteria bacterium]|nr:SH3 domain-containing protein [Deltaproteobacteria bacterium]